MSIQEAFRKMINLAIEREEEAHDFYMEGAENAENRASKKLLEELAEQEEDHKEKLQKALEDGVCETFACTLEEVEKRKLEDYLIEVPLNPSSPPQDVLIVAMKREKASFEFYSALAELTEDPASKSVFRTLAKEEEEHKNNLQQMYDENIAPWM
ncbi:MAG: ferritin family protein [Candidatus Thorarchaeota archaeon]|nr:ferritin family protein [Candidatus Thorarchaeota archaeon]